jgi:hypothetical protein
MQFRVSIIVAIREVKKVIWKERQGQLQEEGLEWENLLKTL